MANKNINYDKQETASAISILALALLWVASELRGTGGIRQRGKAPGISKGLRRKGSARRNEKANGANGKDRKGIRTKKVIYLHKNFPDATFIKIDEDYERVLFECLQNRNKLSYIQKGSRIDVGVALYNSESSPMYEIPTT